MQITCKTHFEVVDVVLLRMVGDNERNALGKALVLLVSSRCEVELVAPRIELSLEPRYGKVSEDETSDIGTEDVSPVWSVE